MIQERLKAEKIKSVWLYGGTKNKSQVLDRFLKDEKVKVLNCNIKTGSLGLNLQEVSNYCIYYERPVSPIDWKQSLKRIYRTGQKKRCYIYSIIMRRSIDRKIVEFVEEGKDLFRVIVEGSRKKRKEMFGI